jgi:predicted phosphodiesterase
MTALSASPTTIVRAEQSPPPRRDIDTSSTLPTRILWPRLSTPAIILNGSSLVLQIKGPANLTEWNLTLYREYEKNSISPGSAEWNGTTGIWNINASIPSSASRGLYDLIVTATDGIQTVENTEYNAIQIRENFPDDFRVFHITDPHIKTSVSSRDDRLLSALCQASMAEADFVVLSGDIVDFGTANSFERAVDILKHSRVPVFVGPGNHDVDSDGRGFDTYISFFGPDYYTANIGPDILFIMGNSHDGGMLNSTQIQWIERDLSESDAETKILCIHHPLYNLDDPPLYYLDDGEALELIDICENYEVDIVLTGHLHNDRVDEVNGTLWILTTAIGAPVSTIASEPDHLSHGFRVIEFEDYELVSWNWTLQKDWSQPWDGLGLKRAPKMFRQIDVGGYVHLSNQMNYTLEDQLVDFMVKPLTGGQVYMASGGTVVDTINGSDAYLMRFRVDLPAESNLTLRIFPSNPQPPLLTNVTYPQEVTVSEEYSICVEWSNPVSGVVDSHLDFMFNNESMGILEMTEIGTNEFCYVLQHDTAGEVAFRVTSQDYAGLETTSDLYRLECVAISEDYGLDIVQIGAIVGIILVAAAAAAYLLRRRFTTQSS